MWKYLVQFVGRNYRYKIIIYPTHYLAPNLTALNSDFGTTSLWGGDVISVGGKVAMMPIPLNTADFMVHHIHAFSAVTTRKIILFIYYLYDFITYLYTEKSNQLYPVYE